MASLEEISIAEIYNSNISKAYALEKNQALYRAKTVCVLGITTLIMFFAPSFIKSHYLGLIFPILLGFYSLIVVSFFWFSDLISKERTRITYICNAYRMETIYKKILPQFLHKVIPHIKKYETLNKKVFTYTITDTLILIEISITSFFLLKVFINYYAYLIFLFTSILILFYNYYLKKTPDTFQELFERIED